MYPFRREDNGEIVSVSFLEMMEMDGGFITLPDGVLARRVYDEEASEPAEKRLVQDAWGGKEHASDSMGFPKHQLAEMRADLERSGCTGITFREEPDTGFVQVLSNSPGQKAKYAAHRQMPNQSGKLRDSVMLSERDLQRAEEIVSR